MMNPSTLVMNEDGRASIGRTDAVQAKRAGQPLADRAVTPKRSRNALVNLESGQD